ncbi:PREDICTED: protein EVI2A [Merops nubicus]|uniref:Protein EVI2A n=1 Tax=Merops nubicus TaxID=57421 RepID=A0A091RA06_MERNU|nr:PREDICTED: protein EVI2A [Merops nubicus]KFQ24783.1 Protein EVI2A [Merops nubicus]
METKRHSKSLFTFPVTVLISLCLQTSANHIGHPGLQNETWNPTTQNIRGSQNITEANTNSPLSMNFSSRTIMFETQTSTLQASSSTTAPNPTTPPAQSAVSVSGGPRNSSKPKSTMTKETCEDNKSLILICFIVIAVLVLICTFLFLSTVIVANKMSYLKKSQQGKRRPRSNGDILATNSLWPTAAGTWQRMPKETAGTDVIMQDLISGRDAALQGKTNNETTEKLTKETDHEQEKKESHKPILTNFVVEI